MANAIATAFLNGILEDHATRVQLVTNTIKLSLVDHAGAEGAPDPAADAFYGDWDGSQVTNGLSSALGTKTVGSVGIGVFDAADMTPGFTAVAGASVESINLIKDTGTPATSDYIAFWDVASGLPLTPNGGDVNVNFNVSGIIKV